MSFGHWAQFIYCDPLKDLMKYVLQRCHDLTNTLESPSDGYLENYLGRSVFEMLTNNGDQGLATILKLRFDESDFTRAHNKTNGKDLSPGEQKDDTDLDEEDEKEREEKSARLVIKESQE